MKQSHKTLLLWVMLILMFVAIYQLVSDPDQPQSVAFSEFMTDVRNGNVEQVTIRPARTAPSIDTSHESEKSRARSRSRSASSASRSNRS